MIRTLAECGEVTSGEWLKVLMCVCCFQRLQRREQFDVLLKEREQARVAALQKYVSVPMSAPAVAGGAAVHLQSVYSPSPHGTLPSGSASLLMLAAADRA